MSSRFKGIWRKGNQKLFEFLCVPCAFAREKDFPGDKETDLRIGKEGI